MRLTPESEKHLRGMDILWAKEVVAEIDALRAEKNLLEASLKPLVKELQEDVLSRDDKIAALRAAVGSAKTIMTKFIFGCPEHEGLKGETKCYLHGCKEARDWLDRFCAQAEKKP